MTKSYTVFFILLLFSVSLFAANINNQKNKRDVRPDAPMPKNIKIDAKDYSGLVKSLLASEQVDTLGFTAYDYGTNSVMGTPIIATENGVHFTYMKSNPTTDTRFVTYNYYDLSSPGAESFLGDLSPTEDRRTGWGDVAVGPAGEALLVNHGGGISFWKDLGEAFYSFTETNLADNVDANLTTYPRISSLGMKVLVTGNDVEYKIAISDDAGDNWVAKDYPVSPIDTAGIGNAENVVLIDPTNSDRLVGLYMLDADNAPGNAVNEGMYMSVSADNGDNWSNDLLVPDTLLIPDGDNYKTYFAENFGQVDFSLDPNGKVHFVLNGYGQEYAPSGDTLQYVGDRYPVVYWDEVNKQMVELTDPMFVDSAYTNQMGYYSGNGIGCAYPSLAMSADGKVLVAAWQQAEFDGDNIVNAWDVSGDSVSDFFATDIYYAASGDGGATWSAPAKLAGTAQYSDVFPVLAPAVVEDGGSYYVDLLYMMDLAPGCSIFGESTEMLVPWVYKRVNVPLIVGIADNANKVNSYKLAQNYPNPFNPSTKIDFTLQSSGNVTLEVYNVLGQKIATLINNTKYTAGAHSITFDASDLSTGIYYYQIKSGDFVSSKKMVLMK